MTPNHERTPHTKRVNRRLNIGALIALGLAVLIAAVTWTFLRSEGPAIVAESSETIPLDSPATAPIANQAISTSTAPIDDRAMSSTTTNEATPTGVSRPGTVMPDTPSTSAKSPGKASTSTTAASSTTSISSTLIAIAVESPSADFYPFGNPYGMKPIGNVLLWQSSESGRRWTIEITNDVQSFTTPRTANTTLSLTFPPGTSLGSCSRETIGSLIQLQSFISFDGGITSIPNPATDKPRICDQYGTGVIGLWNSRYGSQLMRTFPGAPNENKVPTLLWVRIIGQYVYGGDMVTVDSSWVKVDLKSWGR